MLFVSSRAPEAQAASQKNVARAHAQTATTQPHLDEAYRLLRRSHYVLNHACRKLGGHRAEAIKQIELALGEVQAASGGVRVSDHVQNVTPHLNGHRLGAGRIKQPGELGYSPGRGGIAL
jgi:hypothetical protein